MKKFYLIFSVLFLAPFISFATSGACSSHGGVNCSAGAGAGGYSICNDGWTSPTSYSNTDECIASCTPPIGSGCKTESDYGAKQVQLNAQGGYLGGSASQEGVLQQCRNDINSYQSALQSYNSCLSKGSSNSSSSSSSGSSYPTPSSSFSPPSSSSSCKKQYGRFSIAGQPGKCICMEGYSFDEDDQCVSIPIKIEEVPTCNLSFDPQTIILGDKTILSLKTTGIIREASSFGTGFLSFNNIYSGEAYSNFFNLLNSGESFSEEIVPNKIGKTSETYIIVGPGGSNSCTAVFETISKLKKITKIEETIKEPAKIEKKEVFKIETPILPPQIQNQPEVKSVQKQSIFKKSWKWIISLFN